MSAAKQEAVAKAQQYFENYRDRMDYKKYRAEGCFIGSGGGGGGLQETHWRSAQTVGNLLEGARRSDRDGLKMWAAVRHRLGPILENVQQTATSSVTNFQRTLLEAQNALERDKTTKRA